MIFHNKTVHWYYPWAFPVVLAPFLCFLVFTPWWTKLAWIAAMVVTVRHRKARTIDEHGRAGVKDVIEATRGPWFIKIAPVVIIIVSLIVWSPWFVPVALLVFAAATEGRGTPPKPEVPLGALDRPVRRR